MYIVEEAGTVTKIGDTAIDLSSYLKTTDAESTYLKKTDATTTYVAQTSFNNHITDTVAHLTQFEKNKLLTTDKVINTLTSTDTNKPLSANQGKVLKELLDNKVNKTDIVDNLTSTDIDKPLSANQGKILNDTKLNKTDANKLNCVTIDNVSLKEYILTNFTETGKTYYLIARQTCTDLPKASNFYITVETPGSYTYKVTAKELNDKNGSYVCTYRTISSSWTAWEKVLITGDIDGSKKLYITNTGANIKFVKITSAPTNGSSIDIHFKSARTNTTFEEETVRVSAYVSKTIYDGKIIQKGLYAANGNKPNEKEANFLVILDDYSVWAHIASYSTAEIELYSYGRHQSIDGTEATTLPSKVKYSMFNGAEIATMDKVLTKSVADVGVTTITPVNSTITGNIEYTVKNGICYVSMKDLMSTISSTKLSISTTMPKPSINCTASSVNAGGNIAMIYIDKNTTNLYGNFYTKNAKSDCSFSYPVAE